MKSTFDFIVQSNVPEDLPNDLHPGLSTAGKPFQFFYSILQQMKSVIYEDRTVYAPLISKSVTESFYVNHTHSGISLLILLC